MKRVRVLVLSGLLLAPAAAQSQMIHGVVMEDSTREPITGASVELLGLNGNTSLRTQTGSGGAFLLRPRSAGRFIVRLTHPSYAAVDSDTLSVERDETIAIELRMARTAIPLEPLVVIARRHNRLAGFYDRLQRPGSGRFLTRADLEVRPGARATDLLRGMPGIEIVPVRRGLSAATVSLITMRGGSGRCSPTIYIDGIVAKQFVESGVDDFLTPEMLEGMEIYTSSAGAPSPISAQDSCGVVAFWTRSDSLGKWSWLKLAAGAGAFVLMVALTR